MRRLLLTITLATGTILGPPASADNEPCKGEDSCQSERRDTLRFQDSPVQTGDITICTPMSHCEFHGEPKEAPSD